ncbi:MAG: hypothetical protein U0804_04615 [Gemmataceae bacterium]
MGKIVIGGDARDQLAAAAERQELRDESGKLLGYFEPARPADGSWGPFSAEEVRRAFSQTGPGKTLDEIGREIGFE